jgi:putative oxidoreductase
MIRPILRLQRRVAFLGEHLQSFFLLLVRLYWGWQFMQTGWGKLTNLDRFAMFFKSLGLPAPGPLAILIGVLELVGGFLLIAGLFSRLIAVPMTISMTSAYLAVPTNRDALLSIFSDPGKFYGADPYTFLFAVLLILIFGPGWFSVDRFLESAAERTWSLDQRAPARRCAPGEAPPAV